MPDEEEHAGVMLDRVVRELRRPVAADPAIDERVMRAISAPPALVRSSPPRDPAAVPSAGGAWSWLTNRRAVRVSPLGALALAAGIAAIAATGARSSGSRGATTVTTSTAAGQPRPGTPAQVANARSTTEWRVQFVLVAPNATSVAVAGDFNDWQPERTPLRRAEGGLWNAAVPLGSGRYSYAFLVDGRRWVADPTAPRTPGDDFGTPSSVVTVGGLTQ